MNILEGKENFEKTSTKFSEQLSEAEQVREDGEASDRILMSIETDDLDDSTIATAESVKNEYRDAYTEHTNDLNEQVEDTASTAEGHVESLGENRDTVDRNADRYAEAAGISELGKASAELGKTQMESDSQSYSEVISNTEQAIESSREKISGIKSAVSSFFG